MKAYRRAAVASTFSPTQGAVLAEALRFARALGCQLAVLHGAVKTPEKEEGFRKVFEDLGETPEILWVEGPTPGDALIAAAGSGEFDLLIAGALERDPHASEKAFTGSVARRLMVESPCDLLLLPRPVQEAPPVVSAFFAVEPGQQIEQFIRGAISILGLRAVTLGVIETPFANAIALSRGEEPVDAGAWADSLAETLSSPELEIEAAVIDSNTGFGLCDAAQSCGADLMVVCASRENGKPVLPAHLNWMRQVIPMRLLVSSEPEEALSMP